MHIRRFETITSLSGVFLKCSVILLCLLSSECAFCQNNPYKIDDSLYNIYIKAYRIRNTKEGVHLADSLYSCAVAKKDKKAECLALTIPFLYWFYEAQNEAEFERTLKRLQEKAMQTGYIQYYYFGCVNKVYYLLNKGYSYKALMYILDVQKYALKHNHPYGIFISMNSIGQIHETRGEYLVALQSYQEALEYGLKNLPDQEMAQSYQKISDIYKLLGDYGKQLEYAEKGLEFAKTERSRNMQIANKASALFRLGHEDEFKTIFDKMMGEDSTFFKRGTIQSNELLIMNYIVEKKWDKVEEMLNAYNYGSINKYTNSILYHLKRGQYLEAYDALKSQVQLVDSLNMEVKTQDLREVNRLLDEGLEEIDRQRAALQNTRLKLSNTQLTIVNSSLELERIKASESLVKLDAENYMLNFNNQKLEAAQLRDSLARQETLRREQEMEENNSRQLFFITVGVTLLFTLIIGIFLYRRNRLSHKLRRANKLLNSNIVSLKKARDEALQADRMKTMFVQNMSHEIRTPLNAIVGFSQLISTMGDSFGASEKKDMSNRISENSDLLLTIINDILDLTTLESGQYQMDIREVSLNEICRISLDTVAHRKAGDVELRFESDVDDSYTVKTDCNRVKQVLINFLTNAAKNTTEGEIVLSIWAQKIPGCVQLMVTDTGIGIPEDKQEEIFERFKKLDVFKQGTGLGLSICQAIAERLGGKISLDKEYKNGARFIFELDL